MSRSARINMWFEVLPIIEAQSHCLRSSVGAVITDATFERLLAFGYNGNYKGGPNECDRLDVGNCGCIHAEANALVKRRYEDPGAIFTSLTPCIACAKLIINAGIPRVFSLRAYRDPKASLELFSKVGIEYTQREIIADYHPGLFESHRLQGDP